MINDSYSIAATETLDILNHIDQKQIDKIPIDFIEYLKSIADFKYKPNFDHSKSLNEMNLRLETKGILGTIYRKYWASPEEKIELQKKLKENINNEEILKREKYNPNNVFKNEKEFIPNVVKNEQENQSMFITNQKEETFFKKIWNKIVKFFKK